MTHVSHTADGGGHGGAENRRGVELTHCPAVVRPVLARNRTIHGDVSVQVVCREAFYHIRLIGRGGDKDVLLWRLVCGERIHAEREVRRHVWGVTVSATRARHAYCFVERKIHSQNCCSSSSKFRVGACGIMTCSSQTKIMILLSKFGWPRKCSLPFPSLWSKD